MGFGLELDRLNGYGTRAGKSIGWTGTRAWDPARLEDVTLLLTVRRQGHAAIVVQPAFDRAHGKKKKTASWHSLNRATGPRGRALTTKTQGVPEREENARRSGHRQHGGGNSDSNNAAGDELRPAVLLVRDHQYEAMARNHGRRAKFVQRHESRSTRIPTEWPAKEGAMKTLRHRILTRRSGGAAPACVVLKQVGRCG